MIAQHDRLRAFFHPDRWRSSMERFPVSGFALAEKVNALSPRFVVDAGCGYHEFRGLIRNVIGIDLVNPAADLVCRIEEAPIKDGAIDVVLALGSVNFGDEEDVAADLSTVAGWLRAGGMVFIRANPGEPLPDPSIVVFPWNRERIIQLGNRVGLTVASPIVEERIEAAWGGPARRLFWCYSKNAMPQL
jgi:hypothetical protein